ncbi:MAG: chloride channel protein [Planctomycetota bacterium]
MARRFPLFLRRLVRGKRGGLGAVSRSVLVAAFIGVVGGLVAVAFDWLTEHLRDWCVRDPLGIHGEGFERITARTWWILAIPAVGGLVVGWVTERWAPEAEGHGTEQMIKSFHRLSGLVRRRIIAVKAICSAITIGTGGSAGQEGPVAQVGSGVGSAIADGLGFGERDRRIFLLAGASAGIGALFTAPLGGALFAPEVLYRKAEFEGEAIIPCIVSSIMAYTTFTSITGETRAIPMDPEFTRSLVFQGPSELPIYFVLALVCTAVGWLWVHGFQYTGHLFKKLRGWPLAFRAGLGGLLVGALALAVAGIPGDHGILFGGYDLMRGSIFGTIGTHALAILALAKILATSFSIASGGSGGVFAPSLSIGALCGAFVGAMASQLFQGAGYNPACFALVGMGAFFAGVAKTPISAILLVCEMTGSYNLLAPLMLASIVHLVLAQGWSIYETQVDSLIDSPAHAGDFVIDVLESMLVRDVTDSESLPTMVSQNATLREALDVVSSAQGSYFPVVDSEQHLVGIFSLSDIRRIFLETDVHHLVLVRDFMVDHVVRVSPKDSLNHALRAMNELAVHALPVVAEDDSQRVVGMLTRNNLGAAYHRRLRELQRQSA